MGKKLEEGLDRVIEQYQEGLISRREFFKYLGIAGAAVGLVGGPFGLIPRSAWAAKSIRFDGWGGVVSKAFHEYAFIPFTKATGTKVIEGEFGDCLLYTSPSPRDLSTSRMPSSA